MIDWDLLCRDRYPYTLRLIEARIVVVVVRLAHPEANTDPAMSSTAHHHRAIASDARLLWDEIRLRRGLIDALVGANENLGHFTDALRTLERPWCEYLSRTQRHYVEQDVRDGLVVFSLWVYGERDKQLRRSEAPAATP